MKKSIKITIPHSLTPEEAKRRIAQGFEELGQKMTGGLGWFKVTNTWQGHLMNFSGKGLGQAFTGRLDVQQDAVQIEIDLPAMLAKFAEAITSRVESQAKHLLERQ